MIVGIDIGGSTTDAVLLGGEEIVVVTIETGDPLLPQQARWENC